MNGQSSKTNFTRTRKCIQRIATERSNSISPRRTTNRSRNDQGHKSRRQTRKTKEFSRPDISLRRKGSTFHNKHLTYDRPLIKQDGLNYVSARQMTNTLDREIPFKNGYEVEGSFPSIKPPMVSQGRDRFGPHLLITGTESLGAIQVYTTDSVTPPPTQEGDVLKILTITPHGLPNTRLRLLSDNFARFKPEHIGVRLRPLSSAAQSGAVTGAFITDPADVLAIGSNPIDRVSRLMDYADSKSSNIIKELEIHAPHLPPDSEPFYVAPGSDAREEIPYQFYLMAQTNFDPVTTETIRNIFMVELFYAVKLYDSKIPEFSVTSLVSESALTTLFTTEFDSTLTGADDPFAGQQAWWYTGHSIPDTDAIIVYIQEDFKDNSGVLLKVQNVSHNTVDLVQGTVLFGKMDFESGNVLFYLSVEDLFYGNDFLTWRSTPNTASTTTGYYRIENIDLDQTL